MCNLLKLLSDHTVWSSSSKQPTICKHSGLDSVRRWVAQIFEIFKFPLWFLRYSSDSNQNYFLLDCSLFTFDWFYHNIYCSVVTLHSVKCCYLRAEETSFLITRSLYIIDMDGACRKCRVTFRKTIKGYDRRRAALVHPDLSGFYCQKCYREEKGFAEPSRQNSKCTPAV